MNGEFHTSILGCFEDVNSLVCGFCCPACLSCKNWATVREEGCGLTHVCCPVCEFWTRQQLRDRNGMPQDCVGDVLCICCCYPLVICQDSREADYLNKHGIGSKRIFREGQKGNNNQTTVFAQIIPSQPNTGYAPQPQPGYVPQPQPGYAPQPQPGYVPQPQPGYVPQPEAGYVQQPVYNPPSGYQPQ